MIATETLIEIADASDALISIQGSLNEDVLSVLKQSWPTLRFTLCSDEDMPARMPAAQQRERFNLYMVGGGEHCLSLTTDPEQAIGVVLASTDD